MIKVVCDHASSDYDYCGGELYLQITSAMILDESNKYYSIDELKDICESYWDNFK